LRYEFCRPPVLAVRIQEVFGLRDTPRIAGGKVRVLMHLLAPNNRPQQVTDDLASFWANTYPRVRKDLRARYPRHAWPEDPLAANPESRPRQRGAGR
jgi:ATP-dependent helicase HrpB